ncbi:MAG TPA: SusC/RagA family TonB-linked outer membrane protein [Gemmatimonadaceae bacterium]|nr:SusC/RagA family TonB-linked outer membrane protein [Gemmatimonadaceae bacterium]
MNSLPGWFAGAALALASLPAISVAQQATTVSGRVLNEGGVPVQGASVSITALNVGAYTNAEGRYTFTVPAGRTGPATLTARRIGYSPMTVQITLGGGSVTQDLTLRTAATQLEGVVVTALGVTREKSQLGTAQQQISSSDLTQTKAMNVVQQVQGKVSGVQITGGGTQGGSTNITIRGANTLAGNNQPLFVVDGIPVSNFNRGGGLGNGYDFGNAISDLNPDDIETFTVLKGPNAAAIYGSRAANGVIVITTKKGAATSGRMRVELASTYTFDRPMLLPDFQDLYGQGSAGSFQFVNGAGGGDCDGCDQSYGPRLDGRPIDQFTGKGQPWVAHPDNVKDFFETGRTFSSTLAVSGGTERANARLSVGVDNIDGYVPNNFFQKTSGLLSGTLQVSEKLNTTATIQYIRNNGKNRPGTGYNNSILEQFFWFGRQVDVGALKNYAQTGAANGGPAAREYNWNYNYHNNPYWIQQENAITDNRDRFIASAQASYRFTDWLNASLRSGSDIFRFDVDRNFAPGFLNGTYVNAAYQGGFQFTNDYNNEHNTELLVNLNRNVLPNLAVNAMAGGNVRREYYSSDGVQTTGISVAGIYNVNNSAITPTLSQEVRRRHVNSVFGSASFTWNGWWTVEGTARNDWSSTLPSGQNSYFYPSVNTSLILTDAVPAIKNNVLSYLKLRGSVAEVGSDANPYQLQTLFSGNPNKFGGLPQFSLGDVLAEPNLKPEITRSGEMGVEAGFFDGRATLDATYYDKRTRNQIYTVPVSATTGFSNKLINAGEMQNKGFEALLSVTPVQMRNFTWVSTFNYSKNTNKVLELAPGVSLINLGNGLFGEMRLEARKGQPYGTIQGYGFARDEQGRILTEDGYPMHADTMSNLGSIMPDWTGGWNNQFTYRNLSLNVLFDMRQGGKLMSFTNLVGHYSGVLEGSLLGREEDWDKPGVKFNGIDVATGQPNEVYANSELYFQSLFGLAEPYVYDASYVKLREIRLGFDLPTNLAGRLGASSMSLALTGRNLAVWKEVPNVDPEFAYSSGNFQGVEYGVPANPRSIGLSVRITP